MDWDLQAIQRGILPTTRCEAGQNSWRKDEVGWCRTNVSCEHGEHNRICHTQLLPGDNLNFLHMTEYRRSPWNPGSLGSTKLTKTIKRVQYSWRGLFVCGIASALCKTTKKSDGKLPLQWTKYTAILRLQYALPVLEMSPRVAQGNNLILVNLFGWLKVSQGWN